METKGLPCSETMTFIISRQDSAYNKKLIAYMSFFNKHILYVIKYVYYKHILYVIKCLLQTYFKSTVTKYS